MKKHVIVTIGMLLVFSVLLGGVLLWRNGMDDGNLSLDAIAQENGGKSSDDGKSVESLPEKGGTETVESTENREPEASPAETDTQTTMIFAGDVLLRSYFREHYPSEGISCAISSDLQNEFVNADIAMVNQEFPFSTRGVPMEGKEYTFRMEPSYVTVFNDLGIDIVTLANNHVLDYGKEALLDTFTTLDDAGIRYAGAGESKERAEELQTFEAGGKTIGILAASRVIPVVEWNVENEVPGVFTTYDGTALCEAIQKAKQTCDFVAVYVHWGVEYQEYPEEYQRTLAKQYIDSGADFVVGTHTHCLQGIEYYKGKPVFYGLGNFGFGGTIEKTLAVRVTVSGDGGVECTLIPAKAANGCTVRLEGEEAAELYRYMEGISEGIAIDGQGGVSQKQD